MIENNKANAKYEDVCKQPLRYATIAYNNDITFNVKKDGNMREYRNYGVKFYGGDTRSFDYEILQSFFVNYRIREGLRKYKKSVGKFQQSSGSNHPPTHWGWPLCWKITRPKGL